MDENVKIVWIIFNGIVATRHTTYNLKFLKLELIVRSAEYDF